MKKLTSVVVVLSALGLGIAPAYSDQGSEAKSDIKISNYDEHNKNMNQCVKTALEKHPGGVIEVEFEKEDDKSIFEVEIQGKDGKKWEVECDAVTGDVIKDEEENKDKKEGKKEEKK
ncbi:MAG: PepSY domain-containing protein [Candidatus Nitrotoga sp.]